MSRYVYAIEYKEDNVNRHTFNTPIICDSLDDVKEIIKTKCVKEIDNIKYRIFSVNRYELNKDYNDDTEVPCYIFTINDIKDILNGIEYNLTNEDFKL